MAFITAFRHNWKYFPIQNAIWFLYAFISSTSIITSISALTTKSNETFIFFVPLTASNLFPDRYQEHLSLQKTKPGFRRNRVITFFRYEQRIYIPGFGSAQDHCQISSSFLFNVLIRMKLRVKQIKGIPAIAKLKNPRRAAGCMMICSLLVGTMYPNLLILNKIAVCPSPRLIL